MNEEINKQFDEFQKVLAEKDKHIKLNVVFEVDEKLEKAVEELKQKELTL